uniref:diacylglycerol kinase family protein n=1 Tax=Ningiella ruwaisensis TaxID=2364274 RepID=UPI00109F46F7|nr:diacylglycerol kinase family protein [Ningiella ruwaisensis]
MFIIKYYILLSVLCAIAAFYVPNWYFSVLLAWVSLSLGAVSFAYVSQSPWIFRKNDRGNIPFYAHWLFIPFLLGAQIYNSWQRKNDTVPAIQKIEDGLFLACRLFPSDIEELQRLKVKAILDATAEFSGMNWSADDKNLAYLNIPILDHQVPKEKDLLKAINWIGNQLQSDRNVVVHCALGRGRSVLIMAAYLIASGRAKDIDEALEKINSIRGTARLNNYQYKKLKSLQDEGALNLKQKALIVANPVAGGGTWNVAKDQITEHLGQKYQLEVYETKASPSIAEQVSNIDLSGKCCVFACGGDGTVNAIASRLLNKDISLGIIPAGTTNALAHVFYGGKSKIIPVSTALKIITEGKTMTIDAAKCNQDTMLLAAGVGIEQKMVEGADRDKKNELGELAYLQSLFEALQQNDCEEYSVSFDGNKAEKISASSILVANAAPATTLFAQGKGQPNPSDGLLDVTIINTDYSRSEPVTKLAAQALSSGKLDLENSEDLRHERVSKIKLSAKHPLKYVLDGELREADQITIKVEPQALKVFIAEDIHFE